MYGAFLYSMMYLRIHIAICFVRCLFIIVGIWWFFHICCCFCRREFHFNTILVHLFHVSWTSQTMLCFSITLVIYYLIFCKTFSSRTYGHISLNTASFRSVGITKIARAICLIWVYILIRIEDSSWGKVKINGKTTKT